MDGYIRGWMGGWMDGWLHGWMQAGIDAWMHRCRNGCAMLSTLLAGFAEGGPPDHVGNTTLIETM